MMRWLPFILGSVLLGADTPPTPAPARGDATVAQYVVSAAPRSTQAFLLPAGPRTIRSLEVVPTSDTAAAWRTARLRLTWESDDPDPARAAVDVQLGLAFEGQGVVGSSDGVWFNRVPMPYRTRALLSIDAPEKLEGRVVVRTSSGAGDDPGFLHAALVEAGESSAQAVAVAGPGRLVAAWRLDAEARLLADGGPDDLFAGLRWRPEQPITFRTSLTIEGRGKRPRGVVFWYSGRPGGTTAARTADPSKSREPSETK